MKFPKCLYFNLKNQKYNQLNAMNYFNEKYIENKENQHNYKIEYLYNNENFFVFVCMETKMKIMMKKN